MIWRSNGYSNCARAAIVVVLMACAVFDVVGSTRSGSQNSGTQLDDLVAEASTLAAENEELYRSEMSAAVAAPVATTIAGGNRSNAICSSRCTITGDNNNIDCWRSTLAYFERTLVGLLKRFATVQTNMAIWSLKRNVKPNIEKMRANSVERLVRLRLPHIEDKNRPLDEETVRRLVTALFRDVQANVDAFVNRGATPRAMNCPRGCEKHSTRILWLPLQRWLFALSCTITFGLTAFIIVAIIILERRENWSDKNANEIASTVSSTRSSRSTTAATTTPPSMIIPTAHNSTTIATTAYRRNNS